MSADQNTKNDGGKNFLLLARNPDLINKGAQPLLRCPLPVPYVRALAPAQLAYLVGGPAGLQAREPSASPRAYRLQESRGAR